MIEEQALREIAFLADYPPRQCGIATFTRDLRDAMVRQAPARRFPVVAVTDGGHEYDYPPEVRFEIPEADFSSYLRAADFLNMSRVDMLCFQHEFGIYGGRAGAHVTGLLKRVRMPVVTTLHTVLGEPDEEQREVFEEIIAASSLLVVMSAKAGHLLQQVYGVAPEKAVMIPHGIPDVPFLNPDSCKDRFGVAGRPVILTFGLLSPGKGIEFGIRALPAVVQRHPEVVYIVLGATHPRLLRAEGETYRLSLERLAKKLGVERHVMFVNRYVDEESLAEVIGVADIYLTPYLGESQVASGTLARCFGAGKAVVSTPYWHAAELCQEDRGVLVPFRDAGAIAAAVNDLLDHPPRLNAMRERAYLAGREMIWERVATGYGAAFERVLWEYHAAPTPRPRRTVSAAGAPASLPLWRFEHLLRLSDSTGILQHAIHSVPQFEHGYCTDDNARALLLTVLLEDLEGLPPELGPLQSAAAGFVQHAFDAGKGRFRNFLSYARQWIEAEGSEDSHGRALWALGAVVGRVRRENFRDWAAGLFERALPALEAFTSPRAIAFAVLGLHEYLRVLHGDLLANRLRLDLSQRLLEQFHRNSGEGWLWLEDCVTYDNARIPHALILTGRWASRPDMLKTGLDSLRWLQQNQTGENGCFRPVGCNGFWKRGDHPARTDQQPLDAAAAVGACIEAHGATHDPFWIAEATRAFEWFLGGNDLGLPLYDPTNGGCNDGLHANRVNQNQGAESTLSFLIALAEMKAMHGRMHSFSPADQA